MICAQLEEPEATDWMKSQFKTWLARLSGLLILFQSTWAVWFFATQCLAGEQSFASLFIAPGIYLIEILLLAAAAAVLPWLNSHHIPRLLWIIAGAYTALTLGDLWTVGYYLSPSFILVVVNAAYLSPGKDQFTWRSFWIFAGAAIFQFLFSLAPFIKRFLF